MNRVQIRKVVQMINLCVTGLRTSPSLEQVQIGNQPQLQPLTANTTGYPRSIYLYESLKNLI